MKRVKITLNSRTALGDAIREAVAIEEYYKQRGWEMEYSRLKRNVVIDTYYFKMVFVKE